MRVINAGFKSKLIDLGRRGLQHMGYCQSGPADQNSYKLANLLLRNAPDAVAIEIMFGGLELKIEQDMLLTLTGADCDLYIDDKHYTINQIVSVHAGQYVRVSTPRAGLYSYLALSHEVVSPLHLNSVCAVERERLGGCENNGVGLKAMQCIELANRHVELEQLSYVSILNESLNQKALNGIMTPISKCVVVRFVPGYQYSEFTHTQVALFKGQKHEVTHHISSMGVKLKGLPIDIGKVTMYSEGISKGAIQVTPNGQAIIMLHERQTIGGYPKIGSVISADIPILAQCQAGTHVQFVECDVDTAREMLLLRDDKFQRCFGLS